MKRNRFTEEQTISIVRQGDAGRKADELAREHGMSVGTFYAWKAKFGGMSVSEAQRLRVLEDENRRLKTMVADQALDIRMLQSVVKKKLSPGERRGEVQRLGHEFSVSERHACKVLDQPRRTHHYVARVLDELATVRGLPKVITCDNGTEFTSKVKQAWATRHDVRLNFTTPGKATENAYVESFNGRMRDEFLN